MLDYDLREPPRRDRLSLCLTALNGVMGDSLQRNHSPLAVSMGFYHRNRPLALTESQFSGGPRPVTPRLAIFIHGLACNEQIWTFPATSEPDAQYSYGSQLLENARFTPLYLRYNSGLHISENGALLAALLEELLEVYPAAVREIALIGHSLGGLLIRSACHYGEQHGHRWPALLSRCVYLGTPHHGVPWEALTAPLYERLAQSSNGFSRWLYSLYDNRSESMRDIVDMNLIDEHWRNTDEHRAVPWFAGAEHYFIAGSVSRDPNHLLSHAFGDVLVPIGSAQARSALCDHLPPPPKVRENSVIVPGVKHIALAHHPRVYGHLHSWLAPDSGMGRTIHPMALR